MQSVVKRFYRYVAFNVMGMLGVSFYILADTYFISLGLGADGLTALNLAVPMYSFIGGTGIMASMGGGARYSILSAQNNREAANQTFTRTLFIGLSIGFLLSLIGLLFAPSICYLLGARGYVLELAGGYLRLLMLFAPAFIMDHMIAGFVRNDGAPGLAMAGMFLGSLANIVMDYIFIFPMGLGMEGAALATCASPIIGLGIMSSHYFRGKNGFHLVKTDFRLSSLWVICSQGLSSFITEVSGGITMMIFNAVILSLLGNTGVAAYGVVANIALVVTAVFNGIAQGSQPLISSSYGSGDIRQVKLILRLATGTALAFACLIYALVFVFAQDITTLFNSGGDVLLQETASRGLRMYFTGFAFAGPCIITAACFSAAAFSREGYILSLCRGIIVLIPSLIICAYLLGMDGVWLCMPVTELITLMLALHLRRKTAL